MRNSLNLGSQKTIIELAKFGVCPLIAVPGLPGLGDKNRGQTPKDDPKQPVSAWSFASKGNQRSSHNYLKLLSYL